MRPKHFQLCFIAMFAIILSSCATIGKVPVLDPETGRFPANKKLVYILKMTEVNADTLKSLIIVPNSEYCINMVKNMNYFNEVMTYTQLQDSIIAKGLTDKVPSVSDKIGLKRAYQYYKPFVILSFNNVHKELDYFGQLEIYDPHKAEVIYQCETYIDMWFSGWTDKGTSYPLINAFLDYLLMQK